MKEGREGNGLVDGKRRMNEWVQGGGGKEDTWMGGQVRMKSGWTDGI